MIRAAAMAARSSVRPLERERRQVGFIYVVLLGEAHDLLAARGSADAVLKTALLSIGMVGLLCLAAGPCRLHLDHASLAATDRVGAAVRHAWRSTRDAGAIFGGADHSRDEIAVLDSAYRQMVLRISEQWQALRQQDQERRELIANVSHDLRTPLSSLHGYLETLLLKDASLEPAERRRYLGIALDQSQRVGALSQSLFELARLEYGFVQPEFESFSLRDLVQDVFRSSSLPRSRAISPCRRIWPRSCRRFVQTWG
jgi:signal transduction histidine kinase